MRGCESLRGCSSPATRRLESRHVNSGTSVFRYYCESHFREAEVSLSGIAYFEVVGWEPLS